MPFVFSHDARKFFDRIGVRASPTTGKSDTGSFDTYFDAFWLCAQAGILKDKYTAPEDAPMITAKFVGAASRQMHRIRGVAFYYHCKRRGLLSADEGVLSEMGCFFSDEAKELNTDGYALMNGYAHGGFELIYERLGDHCLHLHDFLLEYNEIIHSD